MVLEWLSSTGLAEVSGVFEGLSGVVLAWSEDLEGSGCGASTSSDSGEECSWILKLNIILGWSWIVLLLA